MHINYSISIYPTIITHTISSRFSGTNHSQFFSSNFFFFQIDFYEPEATFSTIARRIIKDLLTYIS